ncbi:MAG TPA: phage holin family protein [Burkholderiales bacterium]|nr:phage holin family protein [Burkholderiales bacterium]
MAESKAPGDAGLGLVDSVKALLSTLVAIAHNRLELLSTELHEEVERVALLVLWGAVALFFAFLAVVFIAVLILVAFWESRVLTASLLAVAFFALALVAGLVARHQIAAKPRPFDASLSELAKDREQLTPRP